VELIRRWEQKVGNPQMAQMAQMAQIAQIAQIAQMEG